MRKTTCVLITLTLILCLSACGKSNKTSNQNSTSNKTTASDVSESGSKSAQGDTVVVPNVVGMNVDEAKTELEGLGLKYKIIFKQLQVKKNDGNNIIYYDDNSVIEQSHKNGTIVIIGTKIDITINQNVSEMMYTVNNDKTITLTGMGDTLYYPNNQFYIPKEYEGYKVSHINSSMLNSKIKDVWNNPIVYLIPYDVIIDGDVSAEIIRY